MTQLSATDSLQLEREYAANRDDVIAFVRSAFGDRVDHDEIYQEAWTVLLERRQRGDVVRDARAFLRTVAWREARARLRRRQPLTISPTDFVFTAQPDAAPLPDEQAQVHLDAAALRQIIDSLEPRHAAVLKLRFDLQLSAAEIQEHLGLSPKRLEKIVTAAYKDVQAHLEDDHGETRWQRRQRSLLLACATGVATPRQIKRAQRMVETDPGCRAMLRQMRHALDQIAALIPLPVLVGLEPERTARWRGVLGGRFGDLRDYLTDVAARTTGGTPTIEQAGAGLSGAAGMGVAAKVALVCAVTAGGTVACVESGLLRHDRPTPPRESRTTATRTTPPREPRPPIVATSTPRKTSAASKRRAKSSRGSSQSASAPPAPSPVRAGSTEFGPGSIGSQSASTQPAAAPTGGGGEFLP